MHVLVSHVILSKNLLSFHRASFTRQVRQRAGVLRPLAGRIQAGDQPLPRPVCVRAGRNPRSLSRSARPALEPTALSEWFSGYRRAGLSAHAYCACRYNNKVLLPSLDWHQDFSFGFGDISPLISKATPVLSIRGECPLFNLWLSPGSLTLSVCPHYGHQ